MNQIRIGILGYGNIGKGVEAAIRQNPDMKLSAIFTRRAPESIHHQTPGTPVYTTSQAKAHQGEIDVMILCSGSATDLPEQGPEFARLFNTIDSFDTHANIPAYFEAVDRAAKESGHCSIISVGWDPGLFSLNRLYASAVLPEGSGDTFWGRGVSQGHSDAIRRIPGVKNAIQYTVPIPEAVEAVRRGTGENLTARQKHHRECYVVAQEGADLAAIETAIKTMPNYFSDYDTTVTFISEAELKASHSKMPHGGFVIRSGKTALGSMQSIEYSLKLESNPEFTSSVLVAYARAAFRLHQKGETGAHSVLDIPPALLSPKSSEERRRTLL